MIEATAREPAARTRVQAIGAAVDLVEAFDTACVRSGRSLLSVANAQVSSPAAMRRQLVMRLSGHFEGTESASHRAFDVRALLYPLKRRATAAAHHMLGTTAARDFVASSSCNDALFVARSIQHLRDMIPVAERVRAKGFSCRFLVFRPDHQMAVERAGFAVIEANRLGTARPDRELSCLLGAMKVGRELATTSPPGSMTPPEWKSGLALAVQDLARNLEPTMTAAAAVDRAWRASRPAVVILGDPTTTEAGLALAAAQASGTPSACIQHGLVVAGDQIWARTPIDLLCAWGSRSTASFLETGFSADRVKNTGAPWADGLARQPPRVISTPATFLVALSGAGHMVGGAEHAKVVEKIFDAIALLPQHRFIFRVHPKDDANRYLEIRRMRGVSNVEVEEPRLTNSDIFASLATADALITLTSTAALDAMLAGVAVITMARPPGSWVPDFAAASVHLRSNNDLSAALIRLVEEGPPNAVAAADYVGSYFGPRDGHAADRVADAIVALAPLQAQTPQTQGAHMVPPPLRRLKKVWTKSPRDNWRQLVGRLTRTSEEAPDWLSGKHAKWNRLPHYLELFRRFSDRIGHPFDMAGKRVMEIGGGPVLGLGPFAVIEGATGFTLIEPGFKECRAEQTFKDQYLFPLYSTHARSVGTAFDFEAFLKQVDLMEVSNSTMEQYASSGPGFDVVLSKSCLEHITDLDSAVEVSHRLSKPGAVHAHYIDFSMHRDADRVGSPFGPTYQRAKAENPEYLPNPGGIVNLLRPSEMISMFEKRFSSVHFFKLEDYTERLSREKVHGDWSGFAKEDLGIANGVLLAIK